MHAADANSYEQRIASRSWPRFLAGLLPRFRNHLHFARLRRHAVRKGAVIGASSIIPPQLARIANPNLTIGDYCLIQSSLLDLRAPITIRNHVIIGDDATLATASHDIDSECFETVYSPLEIQDYVWLATRVHVLPRVKVIGRGAVCGQDAVIVRDVPEMAVMGGNPAVLLRNRKNVHLNLNPLRLVGADFHEYLAIRRKHRK